MTKVLAQIFSVARAITLATTLAVAIDLTGAGTICAKEAVKSAGRVLEFPDDVSVGLLVVVDPNFSMQNKHVSGPPLANCRGKVVVPPGIIVMLLANDVLTERVACLKKLPADALVGILLSKTTVGDDEIAQFSHLTGLRYLDLEATDTSDKGIESLAVLVNLGYLNLSHTMIKGANLAKLGALKRLEYLNISSNDLASNATAELAKLNPTSLRNLDIARTRLKDSDLPNLAKIPGLVWLELMDNPDITDRGVAALRPLKNLCALDLRQTHVTVRGLLALKGLHLASVALGEQPVTIDDLKAVQKAFPGIQVGHGHRRTAMPMSVFAPLH